jgi:hypothetical protein
MSNILNERLLGHIEERFYDSEGYMDHKKLRTYLGLRSKDIASIVGRSTRTLEKNPRSEKVQKELRKIGYLLELLREMTNNRSQIQLWLRAPNPEYGGLSPLEVITKGKIDSVIGYLEDIMKGIPA